MSILLQQFLICTLAAFEYLEQRAWSKDVGGPHDTSVVNDRHLVLRVVCQIRPYKVQPKPCTCAASCISYCGQALRCGAGQAVLHYWVRKQAPAGTTLGR